MIKAFEIFPFGLSNFIYRAAPNRNQNFLFSKTSYMAHRLRFSQYLNIMSFRKYEIEIRCQKLRIDTENNRSFEIQRWKRFVDELSCLYP